MHLFCSTIIPTINRPTLSRAVNSVLSQELTGGALEVIVVNDSGAVLPTSDWQHSPRVTVLHTNRHERSVARNVGAAVAKGRYLHFLDDDDVLLPGALKAVERLAKEAEEAWLYGAYQTVDNEGTVVAQFRPGLTGDIFALLVAGESIPLQASLIRSDEFFRIGGFGTDPAILGVEDRDLGRRLALRGTVAYTPAMVASIRIGEQGSTTKWDTLAENDRLGRERALSDPAAYRRIRQSASSDYWRGRVARAYLASTAWNLKRRRLLTGLTRAAAAGRVSAPRIATPTFWRGLRTRAGGDA